MKYWEIIADNPKKRGWSWGCVSAIDSDGGEKVWIAEARIATQESDTRRPQCVLVSKAREFQSCPASAISRVSS
jgi:hypothetical protein